MKGLWGLGFDTFSCILFFCNNKSPWKQSLLQNQKPIFKRTPKPIKVLIRHSQNSNLVNLLVSGVQGHPTLRTQRSDRGGHQVPWGHSQVGLFLGQHLQGSNCTQSNLLDLKLALHHLATLHTSTLFSISSFGGGIIRDLANFISFNDEIPFAKPIPIPRPQITSIPSWASSSSSSSFSRVPKWLPRFPDSFISCSVSERKCGERLWEDSVLGGAGFGLVDLLLGLCLCFWVCGFWFSILRS